ncbi:MAG: 30S ribosomal protein S1 [Alphaproteobacteria bacterium]|nr:30S ribosomal protein S1 [Alphaproteobacteria bacterium]
MNFFSKILNADVQLNGASLHEPGVETATTNELHETPIAEMPTAHDDFDWNAHRKVVNVYSPAEIEKYDKIYDHSFVNIEDGQLINGTIVALTSNDAVVNIGFKSDGLISLNEFRDISDLKIGDIFEVMVVEKEDKHGSLRLSRKQAKNVRSWERIVEIHKNEEVVQGYIQCKTKGGLIVDIFGLETFLPGSQIDVRPITDYDQFVGKTMDFKVVKINKVIKNAVVSHKALIESDIEAQRFEIMGKLEKGQVLEGVVKNITDFGAFMDLGGLDGLLYITDISWGRISHPSEVLKIEQKIQVVVLDFDDNKKRISLGLKQLTPHPWENLDEHYKLGSVVSGKIVNIEDYGAFLEIQPGIEGLIHVSEITWANTPINSKEFFKSGDEYQAKIISIDKETRKMSLSVKQLTTDPWSEIENKFPQNSVHLSKVKNITPYGVFVELVSGVGGMIHISDLSWLRRFNHPSDYVKIGDDIKIKVLTIDKEHRKLQLGHRQLEEDPWDALEEVFKIGSIHQGTVVKKEDKGASIQLQYGLEGFCPARQLFNEEGKQIGLDETADFCVIEFDRNDKRILLSHSKLLEKNKKEAEVQQTKKVKSDQDTTKKAVKIIQNKIETSKLGDIAALSQIQEKMKNKENDDNNIKKSDLPSAE